MKLTSLPKIEKGIPIPEPNRRRAGITDLMRQLKKGDSFELKTSKTIYFHKYAERVGIKVVTRKVGKGATRVWRVK